MNERRINVRGIIGIDGKLLAVRHKTNDGDSSPYYAVPGGGLDSHESLEDGLMRELFEETGVRAIVGRLLFIQQFPSSRREYSEELEFFFQVMNPQDFTSIDLTATSHGYDEIAVCEFIDPGRSPLYPLFLQEIDLSRYLTTDTPLLIVNNLNEQL